MLGKADVLLIDRLRAVVADTAAPVLELLAQPMAGAAGMVDQVSDAVAVYRENEILRRTTGGCCNGRRWRAGLAAENAELRDLDKLVPDKAVSAVAARVIADSGGAFMRNVLVDAGSARRRRARPGGADRRGAGRPRRRGRAPARRACCC